MSTSTDLRAALDELIAHGPKLHGAEGEVSLGMLEAVLRWLFETVEPSWTTLETGCGTSTIIFAMKGSEHTVISPSPEEHERVRQWCAARGISTDRIRFLAATSETVLPTLELKPLDLVLVDGNHCFPFPFIDWYYTSEALKPGGLLLVDDVDIRPCGVLRDFLRAEQGRWAPEVEFFRTAIFRKVGATASVREAWGLQPWSLGASNWREAVKKRLHQVARGTIGRSPRLKQAGYKAYHRLFARPPRPPAAPR